MQLAKGHSLLFHSGAYIKVTDFVSANSTSPVCFHLYIIETTIVQYKRTLSSN